LASGGVSVRRYSAFSRTPRQAPPAPFRLPLEIGIVPDGAAAQGSPALRIEKVELNQARQRFELSADRAPRDVVLDPNTWMMMDPPKFVAR
jgi:hypothetical protein